ncbi:DUF4234 domain-containing protein [Miniphocaeibacter massiliensis]|uniref:DUF4234 domain-containing protein n=1 Tax=Miniphocaeibacter massiliensis TaxID=2041841 RepID=UPI000C1C5871|nr:DUF4234 domain-containing protein [Miniphocaeibacter massiliensis]
MVQERNVALCIILSIITCGLYNLYWIVCLGDDLNIVTEEPQETSGGMLLLLTIITCGIYKFYWDYKAGERLDRMKNMRGIPSSNSGILYLILDLISVGIITNALIQNEINNHGRAYY